MKRTILFSLILNLAVFSASGQNLELPKTNWQAYGFQKQVEQVGIGYYKSDSTGYQPNMLEVYSFNKEGHIVQYYYRIFGKYESETAKNYVYKNDKLDSINILASATNFNTKQKLHYSKTGILDSITASGVYSNFTDHYSYETSGKVSKIERKHKGGNTTKAIYNHKKNYVFEKEIDLKGGETANYYIYDGTNLFASIAFEEGPTVTFYDSYFRNEFETKVSENPLEFALRYRDLKDKNKEAYQKQLDELQKKSTSKMIQEIPVESTNEEGDWTKRLQIDQRFGAPNRQLVFKVLVYLDGSKSGSTDYDLFFENRVSSIKR